MVNYDFTTGRYRARVKTTYKREDMSMNDFIYSDPYEFTSTRTSRDIADLRCYDDVSVYDSTERWEYSISFYDYRPSEDYTRNMVYTRGARWGYERLQCPLNLTVGKAYKISFTYYTNNNVQITQSWGKWVFVSAESGDTVRYPTDLTMRGGVQITAGRQTTNYNFTFVAGSTNYLIFDFSADKDLTGYYEYFEKIKIEEVVA